ncbi:Probable efflux pump membrane transporter TtgB [Serratia marcescens]|uniref:Probable efflux pump membrane transporter TtgB n=1 Tax=Serratia marcescens TaxID=615 RepID=A0A379ZL89_SERMA|nr:Probable efflux pump membrane transporter TtgB [Serratia marcescens]
MIASWVVAVVFTPYLGVKMLPDIKTVQGGHTAIYNTRGYNRFRQLLARVIARKWWVAASVVAVFTVAVLGMALVKKQFFPTSDRPEVLVDVQMPYGTSIEQTSAAVTKIEDWLKRPERSKNRDGLYRARGTTFLSRHGTGATRSLFCENCLS